MAITISPTVPKNEPRDEPRNEDRMSLDQHGPIPKHQQLREILLDLIEGSTTEAPIPSERDLAKKYGGREAKSASGRIARGRRQCCSVGGKGNASV
jgi:hypothetical protein